MPRLSGNSRQLSTAVIPVARISRRRVQLACMKLPAATMARIVLHAVVLTAGTVMAFHPTIFSRGRLLQTDPGDTLLNHYVLEHSWKCLTDREYPGSWWSPPIFHPTPDVLAYSENLFGTAPLYWLFHSSFDETTSFQLWMMTVCALTYLSMAWVLSRFGGNTFLSALGAAAFAFGLPRVSQLSHQQLLPAMFGPLAIYELIQFFESPKLASWSKLLLFTFLQLLASIYLGWFLVFGIIVHAAVRVAIDPVSRKSIVKFIGESWRSALVAGTMFSVMTTMLMWPYVEANRGFHRSYSEVRMMLPTVHSWASPPPASWWAGGLPPYAGPASQEHHLFPGMVLLILTGIVVVGGVLQPSRWSATGRALLLTCFVLMLVSLQFDKISAWRFVFRHVPGAQGIRAVSRIFTGVYLFWWIGILVCWTQWRPIRTQWVSAGCLVLLTLGLAEQWQPNLPAFDPRPFFAEAERLAMQMRDAKSAFVEPDLDAAVWVNELSAMWAGLKANVPVVNGYSGRQPRGYPQTIVGPDELAKWLGTCQNVKVIGPARLAHAYPMPIVEYRPHQYLQAHRGD